MLSSVNEIGNVSLRLGGGDVREYGPVTYAHYQWFTYQYEKCEYQRRAIIAVQVEGLLLYSLT